MVVASTFPVLLPDPELLTPTLERTYRGHRAAVLSVGLSPTQQVAAGAADGAVLVWQAKPGLSALRFLGHRGPVHTVRFCPSGRYLATAGADATVRLWEPSARGGKSLTLKGHGKGVRSVAFSADDQFLLTASDDKSVKLWSVANRKFRGGLQGHSHWVRAAVFGPRDRTALSGGDDRTAKLWDLETRVCTATFQGHREAVTGVDVRPGGGHCVATASLDRAIRVWDVRSRQLVQHYPAHTSGVHSLQFHHSGDFLLSSSEDGTAKIWDVREGRLLFALHGHSGAVAHAAFSPDAEQSLFASAGKEDQLVKVWRSNLGPYTKKQAPQRAQQQQPSVTKMTARPASAPPTAAEPPKLQRVYHYDDQLPGPAALRRPAYQRPTAPSPPPSLPSPPPLQEEPLQPQQLPSPPVWEGYDDDAPTVAQTMKLRTGRLGGGAVEADEAAAWRSTIRGAPRRQEGGLDLDDEEQGQLGKRGGGSLLDVRLVQPSAPPAEAPAVQHEEEEEDLVPRRRRPPRPDSAGAVKSVSTVASGGSQQQQLQQTLLAMTQTMALIARRLALVEDRLAGVTLASGGPDSAAASASSSTGSATLELPASMRAVAASVAFRAGSESSMRRSE